MSEPTTTPASPGPEPPVASPAAAWGSPSGWKSPGRVPVGPTSGGEAPPAGRSTGPSTSSAERPPLVPALARPVDSLAIASLGTALVGLGVVAIGLGWASLRRIRRGFRTGAGLAWGGIALGALVTLVEIALIGVVVLRSVAGGGPVAGDVDAPRTIASTDLAVGNCIETLPGDQLVPQVHVVPCTQAHAAQVIALHPVEGDTFPGDAAIEDGTWPACDQAFASLPGAAAAGATSWSLMPTQESWDRGGRSAVCLALATGETLSVDLVN